jgi:hypothetical protein
VRRSAAILAALASLALAGCGGSSNTGTTPVRHAAQAVKPVVKPSVRFAGPKVVRSGGSFKTSVVLGHFHIAANMVGMAPVPGMGHLHFMLDGGKFDYPRYSGANGVMGKKLGVAGAYSPALAPRITYSHLPPGRYTLVCMLANNNHTPTGVEAKQTIIVR